MAEDRITIDELGRIFGEVMPAEALTLLAAPGSLSVRDVRRRLTEIAKAHEPQAKARDALRARLWGWVEEHNLRHSEAVEIATEVFAEFGRK